MLLGGPCLFKAEVCCCREPCGQALLALFGGPWLVGKVDLSGGGGHELIALSLALKQYTIPLLMMFSLEDLVSRIIFMKYFPERCDLKGVIHKIVILFWYSNSSAMSHLSSSYIVNGISVIKTSLWKRVSLDRSAVTFLWLSL